MILSSSFYSIESRVRSHILQKLQESELTSDSEDHGLEHYMSKENDGNFELENYEIRLLWNRKFAKKLSKKVLLKLWEVSYFLDDERLRGKVVDFLSQNEKKYHLQNDLAYKAEFASKTYFILFLQEKLIEQPSYLFNVIGNKYTLKDNKSHLDVFEILSALNLRYSYRPKQKPKRTQRHKGYRDHGSLSDETSRVLREEWKNDYQNYELEEEKEKLRKEEEDLLDFIKGFLM